MERARALSCPLEPTGGTVGVFGQHGTDRAGSDRPPTTALGVEWATSRTKRPHSDGYRVGALPSVR